MRYSQWNGDSWLYDMFMRYRDAIPPYEENSWSQDWGYPRYPRYPTLKDIKLLCCGRETVRVFDITGSELIRFCPKCKGRFIFVFHPDGKLSYDRIKEAVHLLES